MIVLRSDFRRVQGLYRTELIWLEMKVYSIISISVQSKSQTSRDIFVATFAWRYKHVTKVGADRFLV